jgi:hypothetical protein
VAAGFGYADDVRVFLADSEGKFGAPQILVPELPSDVVLTSSWGTSTETDTRTSCIGFNGKLYVYPGSVSGAGASVTTDVG